MAVTETKPEYIPVILDYGSDGFKLEELDDFIDSIEVFRQKAKEQYKDQNIRIYFLPADQVEMLLASNQEGN